MSSAQELVGLDLEDLTPRQLRQLLRMSARRGAPRGEKGDKDEKESDEAAEENEKLVDLQEEKKGKSKAPEVAADDLPEGIEIEEPKKKKKGKA
jgi:hypothetical protein